MDTFFSLKQLLSSLLYVIPTLLVIGISSYYLMKVGPQTEGILILVSHIIFFVCVAVNNIVFSGLFSFDSDNYQTVGLITSILSFIGSILLVIGLYLVMNKVISYQKNR